MICKACKREIENDSIFCRYCGEKQIRERKKKTEIKVPAPKQLPSGTWFGRITVDGERVSISAPTEKEYYAKARAVKAGLIESKKAQPKIALKTACIRYIDKRDAILSPSTVKGYESIIKTRFQKYMDADIHAIDWQKMINDEASLCNAKTLKNSWGFIKASIKDSGIEVPAVILPPIIKKELAWLEPEQIPAFLAAIRGKPCEMAALFALHGLRKSELLALTPSNIKDGIIHVEGSAVIDKNGRLIYKDSNKNSTSRRKVKIRIPRLKELIDSSGKGPHEYFITIHPNSLHGAINSACESAGLPKVGVHGLRRSFASLAYSLGWSELMTMQEGGWADRETMNKKYIKLSQTDAAKQGDSMSKFFESLQIGNENGNKE